MSISVFEFLVLPIFLSILASLLILISKWHERKTRYDPNDVIWMQFLLWCVLYPWPKWQWWVLQSGEQWFLLGRNAPTPSRILSQHHLGLATLPEDTVFKIRQALIFTPLLFFPSFFPDICSYFFFLKIFIFKYVHMYMTMWGLVHMSACLWRLNEGVRLPGAGVIGSCKPHLHYGYWKANLGPLKEQYALLTMELSLLTFMFILKDSTNLSPLTLAILPVYLTPSSPTNHTYSLCLTWNAFFLFLLLSMKLPSLNIPSNLSLTVFQWRFEVRPCARGYATQKVFSNSP